MDEVTTFCHLWILEFLNRPSLFLTDHDDVIHYCLLYTSPSPRDKRQSRMPSSA